MRAGGKVKLVKMNIDEHPAIPGQMGIQSIPAVIAFVNGQPADGFMGAVPESQVTAFIDKLTAGAPGAGEPSIAEILQEADAVLAEGDLAGAAQIYSRGAVGRGDQYRRALAGLAKCYMSTTGAIEEAKQTLAMVPESKRTDPTVSKRYKPRSISQSRRRRSVPITELEQKRRGESARSSGAVRSGDGAQRRWQARGGDTTIARDRPARPQMERGRRAQAARAVLRSLGPDR